jgi:hypothetical protein
MIQKYLPTEAQTKQHAMLESKGTAHGKHFDLQPLLDALKTYVDNAEKWNWTQRAEQWGKKVGGAQKLLPVHVVNEYCRSDRSFDPCPAEWKSALPRTRAVEFYDGSKWVKGEFFTPPNSYDVSYDVLGVSFAFYRGGSALERLTSAWARYGDGGRGPRWGRVARDLKSLQALWHARTEQLKSLTDKLALESQDLSVADEKALGQLLKCVAEGDQDQAEALIKKDSKLLLAAGKVTDLSGRTFDNITAFQYALWAMDYHMWTMIQKYLPAEAQAQQFDVLESKGTDHGKHFDLQLLLDALKTFVDNYQPWNTEQSTEYWSKKVGGAQKLLPAHVVNEYCRPDRSFNPCPSEWTSLLPRTRAVEVYGSSKWVKGEWFTSSNSSEALGSSFAFSRAAGQNSSGKRSGGALAAHDLNSLQSLWTARTEQLKSLAESLTAESQSTMQVGVK